MVKESAKVWCSFTDHMQHSDMIHVTSQVHFIRMNVLTFHFDHLPYLYSQAGQYNGEALEAKQTTFYHLYSST